jgi:hypothetical protein
MYLRIFTPSTIVVNPLGGRVVETFHELGEIHA